MAIESLRFETNYQISNRLRDSPGNVILQTEATKVIPLAFRCELFWGAYTYNSTTVVNGVYQSGLPSFSNLTLDTTACQPPWTGNNNKTVPHFCAAYPPEGPHPESGHFDPSAWKQHANAYLWQPYQVGQMSELLRSNFNFNSLSASVRKYPSFPDSLKTVTFQIGIPETAQGAAEGVSNALRNTKISHPFTEGRVILPMTWVKVRWYWLIYPLTMAATALGFVIAVIVSSELERDRTIWKSSMLPLLYCRDRGVLEGQDSTRTTAMKDMEKHAEKTSARLTLDNSQGIALRPQ